MNEIVRFGVSMDKKLLSRFDAYTVRHGYTNRSEAVRDLIRDRIVKEEWEAGDAETLGTVTIIYDHHRREPQEQLTDHQHRYHEVVISTMHVHLDQHHCLEVLVVRGKANEIQRIAGEMISMRGVLHGKLVMTSTGENL